MNKLLTMLAAIGLMYVSGWTQKDDVVPTDPSDGDKVQVQERSSLDGLMDNLPEPIKAQVREAVKKAEQAAIKIEQAMKSGASEKEVEALMEQAKDQARVRLQEAIQTMENIPEAAKATLEQTKEKICDRLEEKKSELEEAVKEKAQLRDGSGIE